MRPSRAAALTLFLCVLQSASVSADPVDVPGTQAAGTEGGPAAVFSQATLQTNDSDYVTATPCTGFGAGTCASGADPSCEGWFPEMMGTCSVDFNPCGGACPDVSDSCVGSTMMGLMDGSCLFGVGACEDDTDCPDIAQTCDGYSAEVPGTCTYGAMQPISGCSVTSPASAEVSCSFAAGSVSITMQTDFAGPFTAEYETTVDGVVHSASFDGNRTPVSDGGTITHFGTSGCSTALVDGTATVCADEDNDATFIFSVSENDTSMSDTGETLTEIRVTGVPSDVTFSVGGLSTASCGFGCVSVTGALAFDTAYAATFTPPANYATETGGNPTYALTMVAFTSDNGAPAANGATENVRIEIQEEVDAPNITNGGPAIGLEDTSVPITGPGYFTLATVDNDGSESTSVFIDGVPMGATLVPAGTSVGGGSFRFTVAQANAGIGFTWNGNPDHNDDNAPTIDVRVVTTEIASGDTTSSTTAKPVQVNADADAPTLSVTSSVVTNEDTDVALTITPALVDGDGSETLEVLLTNVNGTLDVGTDLGGGTWRLTAAQASGGPVLSPIPNSAAEFTISVQAFSDETRGVCSNDATVECTTSGNCGGADCDIDGASSPIRTIDVTINAVADGANVVHAGNNTCTDSLKDGGASVCTDEDTAVTFTLTGSLIDLTPITEVISEYRVENVPTGAIVDATGFAETDCGPGCVAIEGPLPVGAPVTVSFTPPPDYSTVSGANVSIELDITAFTTDEGSMEVGGAAETVTIEVQETADLPTVDVPVDGILIGVEDMSALISGTDLFGASLNDTDGSEQITLLFSGVPQIATISPGIDQGGGVWQVSQAQLNAGVSFSYNGTPDHNDANVTLTLTATATENYSFALHPAQPLADSQATTAESIELQVNGVADVPMLNAAMNQTTDEDVSPQLNFTAALVDTDTSEDLTVVISNLPAGVTLDAGTVIAPGSYELEATDLPVNMNLIQHSDVNFDIDVQAVATEKKGTCPQASPANECDIDADCNGDGTCEFDSASSMTETITIQITAVADMPNFNANLGTINANEGANVPVPITASRVDDDGSEDCTVLITWDSVNPFNEPEMVGPIAFTAGSSVSPTSWSVPCANLGGFQLDLPSNGHGDVEFCATASTVEFANMDTATTMEQCFTVSIADTNQVCDDGYLDTSEECDDGQYNANAPNACRPGTCLLPACGDDIQDTGAPWNEECDDGGMNSDTAPDACRLDCSLPSCGDNVVDMFEACDDGNNGDFTDSCLDGCLAASCGDGFVWSGVEECDTGLSLSDTLPDACRTNCMNAGCTDGVLDTGEACDDGNTNDNDACPTTCQPPVCGDGFTFVGMEECDQGPNNSDVQPDTCRTNCVLPFCGDVVVDTGEACDDGNTVNEDPCVNSCDLNVCGDGFVDLTSEECDDGSDNSNSEPDACRPGCTNPFCGDGVVDSGESCDLGPANNDNDPNGCKTNCAVPGCGDGVIGPGEACDDGAANSDTDPDACRTTCTLARCGDAVIDAGEVCDDGIANSDNIPNSCRRNCMEPSCGDGVVDAGETCDDGVNNSDTTPGACRTSCVVPSCGDSVVDPGEACDDGPLNSDSTADACRTTCVVAECGDGVVDSGEVCDDGAANGTDPNGCEVDCTLPPACGDGIVDDGEECDDGALNSDTEADACRVDCTNPICGDNVVDSGEECDEGFDSESCSAECVAIGGGDMGMGGDDMGMGGDDMGNNAPNAGPGPDAGGENNGTGEDMGGENNNTGNNGSGPVTDPNSEDGCCRTIRRSEDDSGVAGWLALLAAIFVMRRRR